MTKPDEGDGEKYQDLIPRSLLDLSQLSFIMRDFPARGEVSVNCCPSSGFEASNGVGFRKIAETLCLVRLDR